jgi:hypothetical protein
MAKVVVQIADGSDDQKLETTVDADIAAFDEYFQSELKNDPMSPSEKAIVKTFLYFKLVHQREA